MINTSTKISNPSLAKKYSLLTEQSNENTRNLLNSSYKYWILGGTIKGYFASAIFVRSEGKKAYKSNDRSGINTLVLKDRGKLSWKS